MIINGNANIDLKGLYMELSQMIPSTSINIGGVNYPLNYQDLEIIHFVMNCKNINPNGYYNDIMSLFQSFQNVNKMDQQETQSNCTCNHHIEKIDKCVNDTYTLNSEIKSIDDLAETCAKCEKLNNCKVYETIFEKFIVGMLNVGEEKEKNKTKKD